MAIMTSELTERAAPSAPISDRTFGIAVALLTAAVLSFLFWLIYFNSGQPGHSASGSSVLPKVSAILNGVSAVAIALALVAVKKRSYRLHAGFILCAVLASACFLVNYVYYHLHHGDTPYTGTGWLRPVYFTILVTHVVLSMVVLPLILTSVFLAISRRFEKHRRVSRYSWGVWMYVSVTGVAIYALLHA